jgi:signal transduction histidine kinase
MSNREPSDRLTTHAHRFTLLLSYLLILVVVIRRQYDLAGSFSIGLLLVLSGLFTLLFATEKFFYARIKSYPTIYFALQTILILSIGIFQEYKDTWAILYIALGFQVAARCSRKEAYFWFTLFAGSLLVVLSVEFGAISGPGRALAYIVIAALLISYDVQYSQHEDSLDESQALLAELQEAHQKLAEHAAQAEILAALQQYNQMIQELYDSVGQKIFAIQLAAETNRLMLVKDPQRAAGQMVDLQAQTQSTLAQMRQLIEQWRPN